MEQKKWRPKYEAACFIGLLTVLGIHAFTNPKEDLEQRTNQVKILEEKKAPQVSNYNETNNVKYNFEDPLHKVYRKIGIEPNNYNTPEELHNAVKEEYNKLLNK